MQDLSGKITGDGLTAAEWNQLPTEVQNIILASGAQSLSAGNLDQLGKGVADYVGVTDFYVSSGSADAYVLTPISGFQGPTALTDGLRVRFIANIANTSGTVTINVNGLGVTDCVREDGVGNTADTEYQTTRMAELRYDDGAGEFKLLNPPVASDDVENDSTVSGATVTDALDTLGDSIASKISVFALANDISNATASNVELFPDFAVTANTIYTFEAYLEINGVNTEGVILDFDGPGSDDGSGEITYQINNSTPVGVNHRVSFSVNPMTFLLPASEISVSGGSIVKIHGVFVIAGSAGNITFDFRKNSDVSQDLIAREGSWIKLSEV